MIARLNGTLAEIGADSAVIDVAGVGSQILASARTLDALGPVGGDVLVLTELQVREDGWTLFGFGSAGERETFRILTSVQGVGGRVALAILSTFTPDELARAVSSGDKAMIARANGVGPKLAARIANELQGKLGAPGLAGAAGSPIPRQGAAADALDAGEDAEGLAFADRAEAEQSPAVLADLQFGEDEDIAADRAQRIEGPGAGEDLVANPADIDHRAVGAGFGKRSGEAGDHERIRASLFRFVTLNLFQGPWGRLQCGSEMDAETSSA